MIRTLGDVASGSGPTKLTTALSSDSVARRAIRAVAV